MQSTLLVLVLSRITDNTYSKLQKTSGKICSEQGQESGKTETDTEKKIEAAPLIPRKEKRG